MSKSGTSVSSTGRYPRFLAWGAVGCRPGNLVLGAIQNPDARGGI